MNHLIETIKKLNRRKSAYYHPNCRRLPGTDIYLRPVIKLHSTFIDLSIIEKGDIVLANFSGSVKFAIVYDVRVIARHNVKNPYAIRCVENNSFLDYTNMVYGVVDSDSFYLKETK